MDLPTYIKGQDQDNYVEEFNQTILQGLSNNGWTVPQVTNSQLTIDNVIAADGSITTLDVLMPDGTLWYVTDSVPPAYVGKINGALVQFTSAPYP